MKIKTLLVLFLLTSYFGMAQEIPAVREASSEYLIKRLEIRPSLTNLAPEIPNTGRFRIRTVDFSKDNQRREVDIAAVMAEEERMKRRTIELAPPVQLPNLTGTITVSGTRDFSASPRIFTQTFGPDLFARGKTNSVYQNAADATGASYLNSYYSPFYRTRGYRAGYRPYYSY